MKSETSGQNSNGGVLQMEDIVEQIGCSRRTLVRLCDNGSIPIGVWFRFTDHGRRFFNASKWEEWRLKGGASAQGYGSTLTNTHQGSDPMRQDTQMGPPRRVPMALLETAGKPPKRTCEWHLTLVGGLWIAVEIEGLRRHFVSERRYFVAEHVDRAVFPQAISWYSDLDHGCPPYLRGFVSHSGYEFPDLKHEAPAEASGDEDEASETPEG